MSPCLTLFWLALFACDTTPAARVCCTTDADCARLGGIEPRGCPDGYACRDLLCELATCAADADCPSAQPVCDLETASCTGCTASSDCKAHSAAPVCDTDTGSCRACSLDAECGSEVCDIDAGRCVDENEVTYAAPGGTDTAGCTHDQPCSIARAIAVASADPASSLVRLLPGTYPDPLVVTSGAVRIVGTGASLMPSIDAVEARGSAIVEVRGLHIWGYVHSSGTTSFPSLTLRDSAIRGGYTAIVMHGILRLERSSVDPAATVVALFDDSSFEADRSRLSGVDTGGRISVQGSRLRIRITNSILDRVSLSIRNTDLAPDRSELHIAFSTFIFDTPEQIQRCPEPDGHPWTALLENNIFFGTSPQVQNVIENFSCTTAGNLMYPQVHPLGGTNRVAAPRFVDAGAGDYRLQAGSPAIDAAVASQALHLDHDFAGAPRPQGAGRDLGAFEWAP